MCNRLYSPWLYGNNELTQIVAKCTTVSETICTATNGCVITSGGGFSEVYDRSFFAPWQNDAVKEYLARPNFIWSASSHLGPYPNMGEMDDDSSGGGDGGRRQLDESSTSSSTSRFTANNNRKPQPPGTPPNYNLNFNVNGRGFPDISAYGSNFFVVMNER